MREGRGGRRLLASRLLNVVQTRQDHSVGVVNAIIIVGLATAELIDHYLHTL